MEAVIAVIIGGIVPPILEVLKKKNVDPYVALWVLALTCGVGYAIYSTFVPVAQKEWIAGFAGLAGFTSVMVYETVQRYIGKK